MEQKILSLSGMHCPACDILIREIIHETEGIELIELTAQGKLTITSANESTLGILKKSIVASGYSVSETLVSSSFKRKEVGVLVGVGIVIRWMLTTLDLTGYVASLGTNGVLGYGEMFLLGFIASLSTCLALVGGFVIMRGSLQGGSQEDLQDAFRHQGLFQLGRLGGYALGGALLGFIGSAIIFSPTVNGSINLIVSVLLLIMGWNMLGWKVIKITTRGGGDGLMIVLRNFSKMKWGGVVVGALTFLLPCGFTQVAQINAMSTGSPTQGALLLFVFALGTVPVLLTLGLTGNRFQSHQEGWGYKILGVILIVLSLFLIQSSTRLLGWL